MLQQDENGFYTNWEETKPELETQGILNRAEIEQELATWRQDPHYSFQNAQGGFEFLVRNYLAERLRARRPGYRMDPSVYSQLRARTSTIRLGMAKDAQGILHTEAYATPDWFNALYYQEIDQHRDINRYYEPGTLLYSASANKVYVVYEQGSLSQAEAEDLEEGFDIFDAAGPYSLLRLTQTEAEQARAKPIYEAQQGVIGTLEPYPSEDYYRPRVLLPGKGSPFVFYKTRDHQLLEVPTNYDSHWISTYQNPAAEAEARAFLMERYPEIRIIEWPEFHALEEQRIL